MLSAGCHHCARQHHCTGASWRRAWRSRTQQPPALHPPDCSPVHRWKNPRAAPAALTRAQQREAWPRPPHTSLGRAPTQGRRARPAQAAAAAFLHIAQTNAGCCLHVPPSQCSCSVGWARKWLTSKSQGIKPTVLPTGCGVLITGDLHAAPLQRGLRGAQPAATAARPRPRPPPLPPAAPPWVPLPPPLPAPVVANIIADLCATPRLLCCTRGRARLPERPLNCRDGDVCSWPAAACIGHQCIKGDHQKHQKRASLRLVT